jgi:dihydroorotase
VGIETAFPLLYTHFVKTGRLSLEQLIDLLHTNPAKRFGIGNPLLPGNAADFTVFDLHAFYSIDPNNFRSLGKSTPFAGWQVYGKCVLTVCGGKIVYDDGTLPRTFISGGN